MTQYRKTEIASIFSRWLDRYSPPKALAAKPQALADEQDSLLGVFLKMAPREDYAPFVHRVLDKLEYQLTARVWPSKGELGAACSNVAKEIAKGSEGARWSSAEGEKDMRPVAIISRRMAAGEPVGEDWLYGRGAVELIAERLVSEDVMTSYRSGAYAARASFYGQEQAEKWKAEMEERHNVARELHRNRAAEKQHRNFSIPDKRAHLRVVETAAE